MPPDKFSVRQDLFLAVGGKQKCSQDSTNTKQMLKESNV